ncbi:TolC family protein [Marinobacter salarius]|jgi:outer membrane protein TolC|uniref:TolC family protein n=1 Tax=Marinobacter salarius TaxID=1420917 RepID=UPI00055BC130|nr:TolC family protein [Marinobacter salarius]MCC4285729.1 TolC family protein [Marinobacter salarius]
MIRRLGTQATLAAFIALSMPAVAEPRETLEQWIAEALANNASLSAQQAAIEAAEANVEGSDTWADPVVKYGIAPETLAGPNVVGHRFEVSQKLPWPDQLSASRGASEAGVRAARQDTLWQTRKLTASVKEAYARLWYSDRAIELHHETRALVEQLADITRQRLEYGEGTQSELLRIETELDSLDAQLVELRADQGRLSASLIPLLGRRPKPFDLVLPVPSRLPMVAEIPLATDHPLVRAAEARTAKARARLDAAEADRRPTFSASAGYNSLWADESKRWMVGVGVQIPFSGQRQSSAVRRAAAEVSQRQWQTTQAHRDLLASIGDVKASVQAGYGRLEILDQRHLPNQRAHWEASLNELASGTGRLESAINSARQLTGVKLTREAVIRDLFNARARYEALQPTQAISVSN